MRSPDAYAEATECVDLLCGDRKRKWIFVNVCIHTPSCRYINVLADLLIHGLGLGPRLANEFREGPALGVLHDYMHATARTR